MSSDLTSHIEVSSPSFRIGALVVVILAFVGLFGYSIHERNLAQRLSADNTQNAAALKQTQGQIDALNAKLNALVGAQQPVDTPVSPRRVPRLRTAAVRHGKPDPRWKKLQDQVDAQGHAIDSTKQDLANARTELQGSIATNHNEIVALQRKGERNYYEFDITKSKQFSHTGPVGVSLRKANTKHQYADLELMVDDRDISKKHLNVYEPAVFYMEASEQPLEIVINSVTKNHIHGYISTPKYRASELAAVTGEAAPVNAAATATNGAPQLRRR